MTKFSTASGEWTKRLLLKSLFMQQTHAAIVERKTRNFAKSRFASWTQSSLIEKHTMTHPTITTYHIAWHLDRMRIRSERHTLITERLRKAVEEARKQINMEKSK